MNIYELLKEVVLKRTNKEIIKEATLKDVGLDSLDVVEVLLEIEEKLNITFEDDELINLKTVNDVIALIESKI